MPSGLQPAITQACFPFPAMQQEILAKVRRLAERVKAEPEVQK